MSDQQVGRAAEILKPLVRGFLTPIYSELQPNGRHIHAFDRPSYEKVMAGYACGECCAEFDTFMDFCPVCGLSREQSSKRDVMPEGWQDFYNEHLYGGVTGRANTPDEFLRTMAADKDVDQAKLSSLRSNSTWRKHKHG